MLGKYAAAYLVMVEAIDNLVSTLENEASAPSPDGAVTNVTRALMGKERPLDEAMAKKIEGVLNSLVLHLTSKMPFPSVTAQSKRILELIRKGQGASEIGLEVKQLKTRLFDELCERDFLYVSPERVRFYREPMLFGKSVSDRFPAAIDDIEEAGKCLALGQGTACVLHTMRVVEVGLKALGKSLGIPYAPSWESYLSQIATNIGKKHKNKTAKWKRDEKFYRDLSGDLLTVKQAWRNPTMHVDRKYSAEEAEQIFDAAQAFMNRLASHFSLKELERMLK